ncbi:MAG: YifB family Mg chelatase-like AAA ATPase [Proteobacteria bacterium]|nr:YifB family Mg chelatase-like AAA ATPase [Pseudomonadota bacterium]
MARKRVIASVATVSLEGVNAMEVEVQTQLRSGMPNFQVIGLPDGAIRESKERVQAAFHSLGIQLPAERVTVNLAPADLAKNGSHYDLAIAVSLLILLEIIPSDSAENRMFMGELSLDGAIRPTSGCLPAGIYAVQNDIEDIFVPVDNSLETAWSGDINVYGIKSLQDLILHLKKDNLIEKTTVNKVSEVTQSKNYTDFCDIKGQEIAKRAAEIAAAGGHNMLMCGCPGSGKSMIAQAIPGILPSLSASEALEASMIHSISGGLDADIGLLTERPFCDPHHSASAVALTGGGHKAGPGQMSLAHRGVLFLDELPEFPRNVLETLRQPLETGYVVVSRANAHVKYPARFQLIAAMNPSPCGYLGHPTIPCVSTPKQVQLYRNKISGPLLDRIDIHVDVQPVDLKDLSIPRSDQTSAIIKERIMNARRVQIERFKEHGFLTNAEAPSTLMEDLIKLDDGCKKILEKADKAFQLSARGYYRSLKVARTIADLDSSETVQKKHIIEALNYRYIPYSLK